MDRKSQEGKAQLVNNLLLHSRHDRNSVKAAVKKKASLVILANIRCIDEVNMKQGKKVYSFHCLAVTKPPTQITHVGQ